MEKKEYIMNCISALTDCPMSNINFNKSHIIDDFIHSN